MTSTSVDSTNSSMLRNSNVHWSVCFPKSQQNLGRNLPWYQRWIIKVLQSGPIPRHVAFIMDGNRRFARKNNLTTAEGHRQGFDKIFETVQWCYDIGIREVTIYSLSIENFKRSQQEVDNLLMLVQQTARKLMDERKVCVRIIGNMSLLPVDVQNTLGRLVLLTQNIKNAFLNIAVAYTSRDEIAHSIRTVAEGVRNGQLKVEDINEEVLTKCMRMKLSPDPDMLIRTSGEVRLSDFLLWQLSSTVILFSKGTWPDFGIWNLFGAVFYYQRCRRQSGAVLDELKRKAVVEAVLDKCDIEAADNWNERVQAFLDDIKRRDQERWVQMAGAMATEL